MVRRFLPLLGLVLLVLFIARNPAGAADLARHLGTGLGQVADGLGRFASRLTGGGG
jgi:hypothetical protein